MLTFVIGELAKSLSQNRGMANLPNAGEALKHDL